MNRTTLRKLLSVSVVVSVIGIYNFFFAKNGLFQLPPAQRILLVLAIVILLNISSFALRKVFVARRLIRRGKYEAGAQAARQFINDVETRPWKRLLCKFAFEVYTNKPEVLGYMCIASAYRHEGNLDAAFATYKQAIQIDPLCPTAYWGLAIVSNALGNRLQAEDYMAHCRKLGLTGSLSDRICLFGGDLTGKFVLSASASNS